MGSAWEVSMAPRHAGIFEHGNIHWAFPATHLRCHSFPPLNAAQIRDIPQAQNNSLMANFQPLHHAISSRFSPSLLGNPTQPWYHRYVETIAYEYPPDDTWICYREHYRQRRPTPSSLRLDLWLMPYSALYQPVTNIFQELG